MCTSDSSTVLRAQVDLAIPSIYENLFAALDLLLSDTDQERPTARTAHLRALLLDQLDRLDRADVAPAGTAAATWCPRCGGDGDRCPAPDHHPTGRT